jgi:signal transduction histidine kinase
VTKEIYSKYLKFNEKVVKSVQKRPEDVKLTILKLMQQLLPTPFISFWDYNAAANILQLSASLLPPEDHNRYVLELTHPFAKILNEETSVKILSDMFDTIPDPHVTKYEIKIIIIMEVYHTTDRNLPMGIIVAYFTDPQAIDGLEIEDLHTSVSTAFSSVDKAIDNLTKDMTESITEVIYTKTDLGSYLHKVIQCIMERFPCNGLSIFVNDSKNERFVLGASASIPKPKSEVTLMHTGTHIPDILQGQVKNLHSGTAFEYAKYLEEKELGCDTYHSCLLIPIIDSISKEVIGLMRVVNEKNRLNPSIINYFSKTDEQIFSRVAQVIALGMSHFLKERKLYEDIGKILHEIMIPVTGITAKCENILYPQIFGEIPIERHVDDIQSLIFLARSLLNQFGALKSLQFDLELEKSPVPVFLDIILPSIKALEHLAKEYQLPIRRDDTKTMHTRFHDPVPPLYVDKKKFFQIFFNLLSNSIKYHKYEERERFEILISYTAQPGRHVLVVSDTGIGIEPPETEKIFQEGYRSPRAYRFNPTGTGYGLFFCREFIHMHHGKIWVLNKNECLEFDIGERFRTSIAISLPTYLKERNWYEKYSHSR